MKEVYLVGLRKRDVLEDSAVGMLPGRVLVFWPAWEVRTLNSRSSFRQMHMMDCLEAIDLSCKLWLSGSNGCATVTIYIYYYVYPPKRRNYRFFRETKSTMNVSHNRHSILGRSLKER